MERKRQQAYDYPPEGSSSYSARARYSANPSPSARPPPAYAQYRSESPPASAYFSHFSGDHHQEPQPSRPDTNAHFAYSTTLRRHTLEGPLGLPPPPPGGGITSIGELRSVVEAEGARGIWDRTGGRLIAAFTQREQYERLPMHKEESAQRESVSARFAHYSIQVRCHNSCSISRVRPSLGYVVALQHLGHGRSILKKSAGALGNPWLQRVHRLHARTLAHQIREDNI